ncbi:hypothetical protein [Gemmata massiliana]|uniref:hypothetical protein n=1 Tax=Gemmata massiliana TaxID=1210884 RepID=UPI0018D9850A|nr:hypothetical protein [Gemmata massiliana]
MLHDRGGCWEANRAGGQKSGWATGTFDLYGKAIEKRHKTFVATWHPAGGTIRVVLVDEPTGWVAFFCTDPAATVADILGCATDRFSLETCFRDLKEIVGAGPLQVRLVRASAGSFHIRLWDLHGDRGAGAEPGPEGICGASVREPGGRRGPAPESRAHATGVAPGFAGKRNPGRFAPRRPMRTNYKRPPSACSTWRPERDEIAQRVA